MSFYPYTRKVLKVTPIFLSQILRKTPTFKSTQQNLSLHKLKRYFFLIGILKYPPSADEFPHSWRGYDFRKY